MLLSLILLAFELFIQTCNHIFCGGSLFKKYGGHNIVELAANKCPFIVGLFMKILKVVINLFKTQDACIQLIHSMTI